MIEFDSSFKYDKGNFIIDFYAEWCNPCKQLIPTLEEVEKEVEDFNFVKINVDAHPDMAAHFNVMSVPTVFKVVDDTILDKFVGNKDKNFILEFIGGVK